MQLWARLLNAGLAGTWALGVLIITGVVAGGVSGPCALASILLATLAASTAVICHAEISKNRHTSLYEGAREVLGVRLALVLGWSTAVWRIVVLAACARGLGATVDYIMGGRIRSAAASWLHRVAPVFQGSVPDPLAGGTMAFTALLFTLGLERSRVLRQFLNVTVCLAVLFFVTAGATHCEPETWGSHPFLPAGVTGLLTGAALCSAGLLGVTSVRAESARVWARNRRGAAGPSRRLELTTSVATLWVAAAAALATTVVLTMMVHFKSLGPDAPTLVQAFEIRDVDWARLVMATLGISALGLAIVDLAPPLHRLVRTLAADGLLPLSLARDCAATATPVTAIATCSAATTLLATFAPVTGLLQVAAASALLINSVFTAAAMFLRFQHSSDLAQQTIQQGPQKRLSVNNLRARLEAIPAAVRRAGEACKWGNGGGELGNSEERAPLTADEPSSELSGYETDSSNSSTDIDAVVAEFKEKIKVATLSDYAPLSVTPDPVTARRATIALTVAFVVGTVACISLLTMLDEETTPRVLVFISVSGLGVTCVFVCVAARQPKKAAPDVHMPLAPWSTIVATLLHVTLLLQLVAIAWQPLIVAFLPGLAAFLIHEWKTSRRRRGSSLRRRGERIHLNSPPTAVVPTLVPSHQRLPAHSQRRLTRVDTILISR